MIGAAESLREAIGMPLLAVHLTDYQHTLAEARRALGEHACAAAWAHGQTLALEPFMAAPLEILASKGAAARGR
jgi:hypothetical protein